MTDKTLDAKSNSSGSPPASDRGWLSLTLAISLLIGTGIAGFLSVAYDTTTVEAIAWMIPSTFTGLVFVALAMRLLLNRRWTTPGKASDSERQQRQRRLLLLTFGTFALIVIGGTAFYVRDRQQVLLEQQYLELRVAANLKAQQVARWLTETATDVEQLGKSLRALQHDAGALTPDETSILRVIFGEALAAKSERLSISLFAANGEVAAHAGPSATPSTDIRQAALAAIKGGKAKLGVVEIGGGEAAAPRIAFILPMAGHAGSQAGDKLAGALVLEVDPSVSLFPRLDERATTKLSTEVLLIRREGNDVVFVKRPPGLPATTTGFPLSKTELPAVQAVLLGDGVRTAVDYRGAAVVCASRAIAGLPWWLVVKTDRAEIVQPLTREMTTIILLSSAAIALAGMMLLILDAAQRNDHLAHQTALLHERAALVMRYEQMVQQAQEAILLAKPDGQIVEANASAAELYGYSREELLRMNRMDLRAPEERDKFGVTTPTLDSRDVTRFETLQQRKDGSIFPVEISTRPIDVGDVTFIQTFVRDVSARTSSARK